MPQAGCDNERMSPAGPATERSASERAARGALVFLLGACQLASVSCGEAPAPPESAGNVAPTERAPAGDSGPWYLRLRNDTELDLERGERLGPPGYYTYALHPALASWLADGFADVKWVRVELLEDAAPE